MNNLFSIGEFSRTTHLSVKALRHYHDVGLLEPVTVDPATGYRGYSVAQVPPAQVIRWLRDLDMPLDEVRAVLDASEAGDVDARDRLIVEHLQRMEAQLEQTQASVASLRALLEGSQSELAVEYRAVPAFPRWRSRSRSPGTTRRPGCPTPSRRCTPSCPRRRDSGRTARCTATEFFETHLGEVVACIAVDETVAGHDPAQLVEVPAGTLAVTVHEGPFAELDRSYAALGSYVASRAIGTDGPIRERYLVADADDPADLRTEVGWPVSADR